MYSPLGVVARSFKDETFVKPEKVDLRASDKVVLTALMRTQRGWNDDLLLLPSDLVASSSSDTVVLMCVLKASTDGKPRLMRHLVNSALNLFLCLEMA